MVCFSHDDRYVMTSAIDNDVHLYEAYSGIDCGQLQIPRTGQVRNDRH